jgi:HSP20 family protein
MAVSDERSVMATLVKWAPFGDLDLVDRRMRRMLEDFGVAGPRLPTSDVLETETELIVKLDAPGFAENDLSLEVSDHTLAVKGEKTEEKSDEVAHFHVRERMDAQFERLFVLPPEADMNKVEATFNQGVLEVHVPKIEQVAPRKVEIAA